MYDSQYFLNVIICYFFFSIVIISGTNLFGYGTNVTQVKLGDAIADILFEETTSSSVKIRATALEVTQTTPVDITLISDTNAMVVSNNKPFSYLQEGSVASVLPNIGQIGTIVNITGAGLLGGGASIEQIFLDGVEPASITSQTSDKIVVTLDDRNNRDPDFYPGEIYIESDTGAIVVGGSFTHKAPGNITSVTPTEGRVGTEIVITGYNLTGFGNFIETVFVGDYEVSSLVGFTTTEGDSMLVIEAPDGLGGHSGPVKLSIDTGATITSSQSFTFTESGNITTVTPNSGAEGRGVLIEGTNLIVNDLDITSLTIGGSEVSRIVTQSSSQISFIAGSSPNGSKTDQPIKVTLSDGSFTEGGAFTYEDYPLTIIGTDRGQFGTSIVLKVPFPVDDVIFVKFDGVTADIIETDSNNSTVTVEAPRGQEFGNHSVDVTVENRDNIIARLKEGFTYITEGIICSVSPSEGQRGTRVRILGENLVGGGSEITKVTFGSITGTIDSFSNKEINVSLSDNPDTYPMTVDILVVSDTGAVTTHVEGFTLIQPGVITSVTPSSGQYGTVVTITGTGLLEGDQELVSVKLAGIDADIIGTPNDTVIVVSAGTSNATIGLVSIVTATGAEILSDQTNKFEYLTQSDITSVSPMNGTEGTRVKIYGENMLGGGSSVSAVKLGDVTAKEVVDGSNTEITVIAGSGGNLTAGPGDIIVTSNTGATITLNEAWIHTELGNITLVSPLSGQQGVIVTIEGDRLLASNDDGIASVTIAGIAATINEQSSTAIVVEAGYSSIGQSGPIVLELESGPVITSSVNFTYYAAYIDTVSPAKGTNGTYVTITGKNIVGEPNTSDSVSTVTFNGVPCYDIQTLTVDSVQVRAGYYSMPGTMVDVMINSTSGAYLSVNNGWEYQYNGDIQSVEPATVIPGDNITITGTQLVPDDATGVEVTIGETDSFTAYIINISMVTVRVGVYSSEDEPGMDLPVHVIANDGSTVISNGDVFSFKQTAIADTITPYAGQTGTVVVINGSNLFDENDGPVDVYLAGVKAQVTDFTPTSVTVMVGNGPAEGVGGSVTVVNGNGTFTGLGGTAWTYLPELTTEHVSPLSGRNGTIVTVDVTSVLNTFQLQSVYLGDIQADIISNIDGYVKLSVVHSDEASNVGNITLNYQDGIILSIRDAWTYQVPISVDQNSTLKGYYNSEVAITGKGFRSGNADIPVASVSLAGFETEIISQTDTRLVLKIIDNYDSSNASMEGPIVIISNDEAQYYSTTNNITFTYVQVRVDSVSPVLGEKGTRVTISGIGLLAGDDNVSTVTLAGVEVMNIDSVSDNAIVVSAGGYDNNTGPDDITYTMGSGAVVTITSTWSYVALGEITILTPTSGSKGTLVNIIGERLLGGGVKADTVYLNGVEALEVIVSDDQLVQVRAGESSPKLGGEVKIVADTGAILVSTGNEQYFEYTQSGVIDTVTPSSGQFGTVVTITGVDLHRGAGINSITIAGVEAIVTNYSSTVVELIVQRPPTTSSFEGLIAIESDYRTLIESSANFTYLREGDITSVQPAQGQYRTQVVIGGNRLYGGGAVIMSVLLAGIPAHVLTQSDIEIRVRANDSFSSDSQDVSGDIVLISDSGAQVSLIDSWTYVQVGMIDSVSPQSGQYGTRVTITGERLTAGGVSVQSVVINGVGSLEVLSSSSTEVVFRAGEPNNPSPSSGTIQLVSNDYGEFNSQVLWNYTAASQVYEVLPANGTGGSVIMIIGDNLLGGISLNVSSVEIVGININRVVSQNDTVIEVEVGFNPDGQEKEGDITIETTSGSIIHLENGWKYLNECPIGQFGNNTNSCSICDTQCVHCYGPTDYDCYSCQNFKIIANSEMQCVMKCPSLSTLDKECVNACGTDQFQEIRLDNNTYCIDCHEQCNPNLGCTGITNTLSHCNACLNVELDGICIEACPLGYYVENGSVCMPCNEQCTPEAGCRGPDAYECNECLNVTIYKNAEQVDECIPSCPGNYYTDFTGFCRLCHSQCNGGCDGPYPSDCYQCKNVFVKHTGCVEECPDPNRYFVNEAGHCLRCHEYCSTNSSCNGPEAKDCDKCLNFTGSNTNADEFFPRYEGECVRECPNINYYVDLMTGDCKSCHQNCTMGCTGSSETDCIVVGVSVTVSTTPTEKVAAGHFTAGVGTIGLVVCVIVVLFLVMLIVIVVLGCKLNKGNGTYLFAENAENTVVQMTTTTFSSHGHGNNGDTRRPGDNVRPSSISPIFQSDPFPSDIDNPAENRPQVNSDLPSMPEIESSDHSQTMSEAYMEMQCDYNQQQKEKQSEPSVPPPSLPPKSARLSSGDPSLPQVHPRLTNQRQSGKFHKPPALPPPQQLTFVDDDSNDNDNSTFLTSGGNSMELLTQDEYEEPFVALSTLPRLPPSLSTLSSLSRQGSVPAPPTSVQAPPTSVHTPPTSENIYEVSDDDSGPLYEETGGNNGIHQPLPSSVSMPQVPPAIPDRPGRAPPLPSRSSRTSSASTLPSRR